jgi:hypothetical protein
MNILNYYKTSLHELTAWYSDKKPKVIDVDEVENILLDWEIHNQKIIDKGLENDPDYTMYDTEFELF